MPWNPSAEHLLPKRLKIGIIWSDNVIQPHPPITRALKSAAEKFKAAGHEIIDWDTSAHKEIQELVIQMYFLDAAHEFLSTFQLGNEPPVEIIRDALNQAPARPYTIEETWQVRLDLYITCFLVTLLVQWY